MKIQDIDSVDRLRKLHDVCVDDLIDLRRKVQENLDRIEEIKKRILQIQGDGDGSRTKLKKLKKLNNQ